MKTQRQNLKQLVSYPEWQSYLDLLQEDYLVPTVIELFALEPTKADNFVKFVQLKSRMNTIRDITYMLELQLVEDEDKVVEAEMRKSMAQSYIKRFMGVLAKLWRK